MKNRTKKGFTLLELIIVMAIFSILLVGALQLVDPVERIFKSASVQERTYSLSNNIEVYLKSKLEFAEGCWVYTSDQMSDPEATVVQNYANHFLNNIALKKNDTDGDNDQINVQTNIYVMRLINSGTNAGQITLSTYSAEGGFKTDDADVTLVSSNIDQLNETFFSANDAVYNIGYSLGRSDIIVPSVGVSADYSFYALENDYNDVLTDPATITYKDMTINIGIEKQPNAKELADDTLAPGGVYTGIFSNGSAAYRAFKSPSAISVCSIPLMNISFNNGRTNKHYFMQDSSGTWIVSNGTRDAFEHHIYETPDFQNDIIFVFHYADEITRGSTVFTP